MTNPTSSHRRAGARLWAAAAAVSAAGVVVGLTLAPRAIVAPARALFVRTMDAATAPLLEWMAYDDIERTLNALLFVPLGATLALLVGRRAWPLAMPAGLVLSAAVEYAQVGIPGRVPDPQDVVWNTLGAAGGALAVGVGYGMAAITRRAAGRLRRWAA